MLHFIFEMSCLCLHVTCRVEFTNVLAVVAQYTILLAFLAALVISTGSLEVFGLTNFALGTILWATNLAVVTLAIVIGWKRYREDRYTKKSLIHDRAVKIEWAAEFSANKVVAASLIE